MTNLNGRVIIVTGGGQGIGAVTAQLAADRGAKIVVADINGDSAARVAGEIRSSGGQAIASTTDITDENAVKAMVELAVTEFGRLDSAVNNAALAAPEKPIADIDPDALMMALKVDLFGTALCLKYEIAQMVAQGHGGSIVNISSAAALKPGSSMPGYAAAKHGVIGLTKSTSKDYGKAGIRVNCVAPGNVQTTMLDSYLESLGVDPEQVAQNQTTLGRFAQPEEIAEGSLWLISDAASYVNGTVLGIDGGYADV